MNIDLIFGPPGTGKTTYLMDILGKELKNNEPEKIAFCSFTKKGCNEGVNRAIKKFKLTKKRFTYFRTIHSLAFRELGITRDEMIQKEDYKELGQLLGMKFQGYYTEQFTGRDDEFLFFEQLYRNNKKATDYLIKSLNPRLVNFVAKNYRKYKEKKSIYDYTDLLEMYLSKGEPLNIDIAIIDEAQDLTSLQWQVIWKMFKNCRQVYIAGDDDQSIYEWAGSDVNYFLSLIGNIKILDQSYRLPKKIHEYALKISEGIKNRVKKDFKPKNEDGEIINIKSVKDLTFNSEEDFLFLARNKKHLLEIEKYLRDNGFVYISHGQKSYSKEILKAINCFSKSDMSIENEILYKKFIDGEIDYSIKWYDAFNKLKPETITYYRDLIGNKRSLETNIYLSTIHASKGGEAENVILILDYSMKVADNYVYNNDAELRTYYVAVTRAKKRLYLLEPRTKNHYPILTT